MFLSAGIAHFGKVDFYDSLVPESLDAYRRDIDFATGVLQVTGGIAMFIPRLRSFARWANLALLVPTFPASVDQARRARRGRELSLLSVATARVTAQIAVAAVLWWATEPI